MVPRINVLLLTILRFSSISALKHTAMPMMTKLAHLLALVELIILLHSVHKLQAKASSNYVETQRSSFLLLFTVNTTIVLTA